MEKCKEFNLPYNKYETMSKAVASHFRVMKNLGKQQKFVKQNSLAAKAA